MRTKTSPPSTDEGPDPRQIKLVVPTEDNITPDEEYTKQDQVEEETMELETTATETASIAITANFKGTNRKNAEKE